MNVANRYHALTTNLYPWFEPQWQRVCQLLADKKLPHALIVNGVKGIGKLHFASSIAQLVLCQNRQSDTACGGCRSCQLFTSSGHPDLYHLSPEDQGGQIKVDQVRDLSAFMQSTAQQGGYRVVILDPAEAMNLSASNALLKTLEEPGRDSLLLLISHQLGQVMPTIKSRCQRIDCPIPEQQLAVQWLEQQLSIEQQAASQLLKVVHGAPLLGLNFKEQGQSLRAEFFLALKSLLQRKSTAVEVAPQYAKADMLKLLAWMYSMLVDVSKLHLIGTQAQIVNDDMSKMLGALAKRSDIKKVYRLSDKIQRQRAALLQHQNPNRQLLLEDLLLDWNNLI
ncbi:MAG: DNA polymerase III subunit delta' [Pseudomonadales bacterium]|nr:DNA polymerase III subunit delta' [Pseudomonadales bacterium]NRA17816.1 DNA polymerase III subunit delta' [Oceanospirillaceae bacterium]